MTEYKMREEFERSAKRYFPAWSNKQPNYFQRLPNGDYADEDVEVEWGFWQAACGASRTAAIEEAAKHAKRLMTSRGGADYNEGWNAALDMLVGDFRALARPVPPTKEG